ncbi:hypothetical protein PA17_01674 [Pseudomonas aeruginosa]|uniref:HAD family hydrolase n=1 Tax=Pseudomonas aeruginosa TaxID=287 RepID=UPI000DEF147C|nr:HAD hydrolase-like protein [Pseudomonas aeruginosa]RCM97812.1 hypothetical protein PA17_01674 [Pseudomonas aeruginosa]
MTTLWISDADNTLWDTNKIYADSQIRLLSAIEKEIGIAAATPNKLQFIREIDQQISKKHHLALRYPTEILVSAVIMRLQGTSLASSVKQSLLDGINDSKTFSRDLAQVFRKEINESPPLREGVLEGLIELQKNKATVIIATEGSMERVKKHCNDHEISNLIHMIIEGNKSKEFYQRLLKLHPYKTAWSIGDQLTRDILPAMEAGLRTIYFPGGFNPFWQEKTPTPKETLKAESYSTAVRLALTAGH